jgi:hypothetical protein
VEHARALGESRKREILALVARRCYAAIETAACRLDNPVPAPDRAGAADCLEVLFREDFPLQSPRLAARSGTAARRRPLSTRIYSGLSLVRENEFG